MDQQDEDESNVNNNNENQLNSQDVNPVAEMEDMKKGQMNMKNGGQDRGDDDDDNEEYDDDIVQESGSGNFKNSINNINEFKNVDQYNSNEFNVNTKQNDINK